MNYVFAALIIASIVLFIIILKSNGTRTAAKPEKPQSNSKKNKPCPVCGTMLYQGEKVTSHEYRWKDSSMVHVFGCPHCFGEKAELIRVCPVCKKEMGAENYLKGIMTRGDVKIHLKIKGCCNCA